MEQQSDKADDVKDFVMKSKTRLKRILERLGWSEEGVLKNFNSNSVVSSAHQKPKKICPPKIHTYPESLVTTNSLTIDTQQLQQLLKNDQIEAPQNFRDLQANFSREQKLQIYEHVIGHTEKIDNNTVPKVAAGGIPLTEIFAQKKREEKRNKRKFRKSKPTHIEEVRSLVDLQMQAWHQFVENQQEKTSEENIKKDTCQRERKRSRSRDYQRSNRVSKYNDGPSPQRMESRRHSKERTNDSKRRYIDDGNYRTTKDDGPSPQIIESRRRCKERTIESSIRYINDGKDRTTKTRSRSRSYDHRKRSRSRETNSRKSTYKKEIESYHKDRHVSPSSNRRWDYDNSSRRVSISPQATSSRVDLNRDRQHDKRSSYTRSYNDTDYADDRHKCDKESERRGENKSRDKEKYYSKHERVDKHKEREHKSSHRHRSEERKEKKSNHKRKKHKKDHRKMK